jgi:hypothetical protein
VRRDARNGGEADGARHHGKAQDPGEEGEEKDVAAALLKGDRGMQKVARERSPGN